MSILLKTVTIGLASGMLLTLLLGMIDEWEPSRRAVATGALGLTHISLASYAVRNLIKGKFSGRDWIPLITAVCFFVLGPLFVILEKRDCITRGA
jgi:hypothetical protein